MNPEGLLIVFFLFTLGAISAVGYALVLRPSREGASTIPAPLTTGQSDLPTAHAAVLDMFRLIGEAFPGKGKQEASARILLATAGYRWPSAVPIFFGIKWGCAVLLAALAAWASSISDAGVASLVLATLAGVGFGYLVPDRVLERLAAQRAQRLRRALPAALDLMVLALEAGQGLDAAMLEASRGLRVTHPDLAAEFTQLQLELRANASRQEALRNFAGRGRDAELRKFANLLMDTDRFGASLGPALRTHSRYLRLRFKQLAQERGRKVAVKLIFPVFFLIFPSVLLVSLGPAVILIMTQLHDVLGI